MKPFSIVFVGCLLLVLALLTLPAFCGPLGIRRGGTTKYELPGGYPGEKKIKVKFEGGKRASIILEGDHRPVADLGIEVYDDNNRLVAKDEGKGDFAAVIWYPPVTGEYVIRLLNKQKDYNLCYLVIK